MHLIKFAPEPDKRTFLNQVPNNARNCRLTQPGHLGQFGTRNLIIVQADRLQNIKPIDVAKEGWTSRGHCRMKTTLSIISNLLDSTSLHRV
jgi:hypothetical protein